MKPLKLDDSTIRNARDYVLLTEKVQFVESCADKCFDTLNIRTGDTESDETLPPMYKENISRKNRCLMGALANLYLNLGAKTEPDCRWMVTEKEYDRLAGAHLQNQLERAKADLSLREKAFDILGDYKDLERRLNAEIHALSIVMNDPASRLLCAMNQAISKATLEGTKESFRQAMGSLSDLEKDRKEENGNG